MFAISTESILIKFQTLELCHPHSCFNILASSNLGKNVQRHQVNGGPVVLPFSLKRVAAVLAVGGYMLVDVFRGDGGRRRQVQTPVAVIGVLLLHVAVCYLLPQLL